MSNNTQTPQRKVHVPSLADLQAELHQACSENQRLNAEYEGLKHRYLEMHHRSDFIFAHPVRFLLATWYHRYIKRDRI